MAKSQMHQIADDACFQIACAKEMVSWLHDSLKVAAKALEDYPEKAEYLGVIKMAIYNAESIHNQLDAEGEALDIRIEEAAGGVE